MQKVTFVLKPTIASPVRMRARILGGAGLRAPGARRNRAASNQALEAVRDQERQASEKRAQQREMALAEAQQRAVDDTRRAEIARATQAGEQTRLQLEEIKRSSAPRRCR